MIIDLPLEQLMQVLSDYIWPFVRIGAFMVVMPLVGSSFVPTKVRLLLAVVLTLVLAPTVPATPDPDVLSVAGLVTVIQEVAIGVAMGFLVQLVFDAIALAGQVIGMSMGLGFAVFLDRARGINIPVLGQLFMMLGMLIFLTLDGHLAMVELLARSFQALPIGAGGLSTQALSELLAWTGQMFVFALRISLPAITAILVVNLAFGVMSRAAPTLNLFAVGFPVAMLSGFAVIFLNMEILVENVSTFIALSFEAVAQLFEL